MPVLRPMIDRSHPDRFSECQRAIEDSVINIIGEAKAAGWEQNEILAAIIEVADNMALALNANVLLSIETELTRFPKRKDV
jgi:hypothetical protein